MENFHSKPFSPRVDASTGDYLKISQKNLAMQIEDDYPMQNFETDTEKTPDGALIKSNIVTPHLQSLSVE
jgi:hypothetical protein